MNALSLNERIDAFYKIQLKKVPEKIQSKLDGFRTDLEAEGILNRCVRQGDIMPDFSLKNQAGKHITLSDLLNENKVVLSFFRGGWCTYDMFELQELQKYHAQISALNTQIVSISPTKIENSSVIHKEQQLDFDILYDKHNDIASSLGIGYLMNEEICDIYEAYGIDIVHYNAGNSPELPLAATYIIDKNRKILVDFVHVNHKIRLEPLDILKYLKAS
jgi:peroxiredoxin